MGVYSNEAKKAVLESNTILGKASEDYYKAKMFYGNVQLYIDASNETEAKYFAARAINDFDTFCKCYAPDTGGKLNGIVAKPVGECTNQFIACTTDANGSKKFEFVTIQEGKIRNVDKKIVLNENKLTEMLKSAIEAVKKAIVSLIDKITGWLDKHPDSKVAQKVKEILTSLKGLLTKADKAQSKEDIEELKKKHEKAEKEFNEAVMTMDYDYFEAVITTDTIRKELRKLPQKEGKVKICLVKDFGLTKSNKNGAKNVHPYVSLSLGYANKDDAKNLTDHVKTIKIGYKMLSGNIENLISKSSDGETLISESVDLARDF